MSIPQFSTLPDAIQQTLLTLKKQLLAWDGFPKIEYDVIKHWDHLIGEWATRDEFPLLVRRSSHPSVCLHIEHTTGRLIAPCDNSPAHWVAIQCFKCLKPQIEDLRELLPSIPMTMALSKQEIMSGGYNYTKTLSSLHHAGKKGWYLAHKKRVGGGFAGPLEHAPIHALQRHMCRFLKPSNFMLIPKVSLV